MSDLLDNMRHGSVPMTLATLVINGVGEELFFRDVARRALSDVSSPTLHLVWSTGMTFVLPGLIH
ncbi:type II CAAX prenyl endopeptidase Rce1 family protein [uncultured Corynebacterium sp.]|uniref:CPBP family glutamic-type intramembrane protease n=1 Tax=uncultured Corynebacterium sp. TaxID=159447 RepID=UPI002804B7D7|nr:CPBP family glutamic-type intramembrane protease [uncultured Corynebacterium sp.]